MRKANSVQKVPFLAPEADVPTLCVTKGTANAEVTEK
jgi:hypothetical protein